MCMSRTPCFNFITYTIKRSFQLKYRFNILVSYIGSAVNLPIGGKCVTIIHSSQDITLLLIFSTNVLNKLISLLDNNLTNSHVIFPDFNVILF